MIELSKKEIIILLGGFSAEKEISMVSGEAVYQALLSQGLNVIKYELTDDIKAFMDFLLSKDKSKTIVFNALHGKFGEDGRVVGLLDMLQIPYTHSGFLCSGVAMDKSLTKQIAKKLDIHVAHEIVVSPKSDITKLNIAYPVVVKPNDEGSSVGLYMVNNIDDLKNALTQLSHLPKVMIESFIKGVECTVGVLNGEPLSVTEIIPTKGFYDYEAKYAQGGSTHIIPARISKKAFELVLEHTKQMYNLLQANGVIRADFIIQEDIPFLLEVNSQPGMTPTSLLPEQANHKGISFEKLCVEILRSAKFNS